jgi:hypothetical protein
LLYFVAYVPVNREWKIMMVSSRSQMKTLSVAGSGTCCAGDEDVFRLPRPRDLLAVLSLKRN